MRWALVAVGTAMFGIGVGVGYFLMPEKVRDPLGASQKGLYSGTAEDLVLSTEEAQFAEVLSSQEVGEPSADKRRGFASGWEASLRNSSPHSVVQAEVTIYVYNNNTNARRAYDDACPTCSARQISKGVAVKYGTIERDGVQGVFQATTCRNLYVFVLTTGTGVDSSQLGLDGGYIVGATYRKAMKRGMARCAESRT